jgi:ribose transport system ATP-binding protein
MSGTAPILAMKGVSKSFPGVRALTDVQLTVYPGEVHALMGENGAGKSTLMKILAGAHSADPGADIRVQGQPVTIRGPLGAKALGIAIIYQELALAPNLTVAENIHLGCELTRPGLRIDRRAMNEACRPVLLRLGAPFTPETLVGTLSIAEQQLVEIARALAGECRLLILDEPTSSLGREDVGRLFERVRQLRERGTTVLYISHFLEEVRAIGDRFTVLRDGATSATGRIVDVTDADIVRAMAGRPAPAPMPAPFPATSSAAMRSSG